MTAKIFLKLIGGLLCLLLLSLITVDYFVAEVAKNAYIGNLTLQLGEKGRMLEVALRQRDGVAAEWLQAMAAAAGGRITLIASDGRVLADSQARAAEMENHRGRPEVREAMQGRTGSSIRRSATVGVSFLYVATPAAGGVVRMAVPLSRINTQVNDIRRKILVSTALAFLPAVALVAIVSRLISRRLAGIMAHAGELARGNFRSRLADRGNNEFGQLERTLNETAKNLQNTVEQLQREHAELEKLERIRRDFVINVSHELRTPLASIQGYTETLIDGAIHDPAHNMRFLGIIRHNAERLARLTADLLTLSRFELRDQNLEFESHDVNALLHDAVDLVAPIAAKKSIRLAEDRAPEGTSAQCDSEAVGQILSNLLDNAIKYTPAGGEIAVGARPAGGEVEVYVRDTGIGIPPEDVPRLFERFYRVDKARSRELGGTGLGLSIVKHLVLAHHGAARVESQVNRGSTFYFTLPVQLDPRLVPEGHSHGA